MSITITQPVDDKDKVKIYRFLYDVWSVEFSRDLPGMDHERKWVKDNLDDWARHIIAIDDAGRIVACIRLNLLNEGVPNEKLSKNMHFGEIVDAFGAEHVAYASRLAVSPSLRGGTAASLLMGATYRAYLQRGILINTSFCQLSLVHLYYHLGTRPYAPNFRIDVGVRTPLIGCVRDRGYLKKAGSPILKLIPESMDDHGETARQLKKIFPDFREPGFDKVSSRATWALLAHGSPSVVTGPKSKVFEHISDGEMSGLMTRLARVEFAPGELVYRQGEDEKGMGVLLSGSLGVAVGDEENPHFISVIKPGDPFGELNALGNLKRTANVKALEKSEAVLLPSNLFDLLKKKHPGVALQISKNMMSILADRLAVSNKRIIEASAGKSAISPNVRRPTVYAMPQDTGAEDRVESYHFATLGDRGAEYERLVLQATVAENLEFSILKRVGLTDGQVVLDLGSGPGMTSALLARNFPSCWIIGVEPERQLREKAEAFMKKNDILGCRFIEGTAQEIPLPDNAVDFSYARLLFQHIPERVKALLEMKRVTREDGIVCVVDVDDGTLLIHPEPPGWSEIERRVGKAQAAYGGDRLVGRKLLGYMREAGFSNITVDILPVTTHTLGPKLFGDIVLGFKRQILERSNDLDEETIKTFDAVLEGMQRKDAFASENMFIVHGVSA